MFEYLPNIIFVVVLFLGLYFFCRNLYRLYRNINLGKQINVSDNKKERFINMSKIALGQGKLIKRPISGFLHVVVYVGFVIINIELLEIVLDGILGSHRLFSDYLGDLYGYLIGTFEFLAVSVLLAVSAFWIRRNIIKLKRFFGDNMKGWPKNDANIILYFEVVLMILFITMNATDMKFQEMNSGNLISGYIAGFFNGYSSESLHLIERACWWAHIIGILIFMNYLYFSKHLHILLAFPNTYFAKLNNLGEVDNLNSVTNEVKLMMDPETAFSNDVSETEEIEKFGSSDVMDLNKLQLLNAYSCTECGRCTSVCPANITGKKLSPRKIMMDTRDRIEEVGKNIDLNNGNFVDDGKTLLNDYITKEELWACTSCNACVQECPISIDPLSIILDMRRYLVMEESAAPLELNNMMSNIENNGAPWPYNQMDRLNWKE
ncbi:(Fe-S)-binding protein [Flavobacteriaceae bacterium]|jgi:heterodisulfide reductase subunit C|nr:(Fe-S)-binding protein [Flavobacteriaceae bacterium]MDB4180279.1 (Fe-S)-binding protein [Flavobacteriaceae bacterium]MDB4196327.1 (Fe-S)-binding protein [Flavobacteriaceae bacterium]MDB4212751.1 (Fe-S)-binding protein [Flavobacteriaceae bacterium]